MAVKRPTPKKLSVETSNQITAAYATQTTERRSVKTYDPAYPVFEIPVNQKVLVYIPNHQVTMPDGTVTLQMDKFAAHPYRDGKSYGNIRCLNGVTSNDPELNWDGSCPLCDGLSEVWNLYRHEYADVARSKGIDPEAPEAGELLKNDRMELANGRVIREPEMWYTFPIVVIECEEKDGQLTTTPKLDPITKQIKGTPMWYSIREKTFQEKWVAGYDSLDGETPTSPAGLWAILNFTYTPKSGQPDKMGSAKSLKVTFKTMDNYADWAKYFDSLTVEWTPAKAQEVLVLDAIRSMAETQEVADTLLKPVRDRLALYNVNGSAPVGIPQNANADNALANFGGTPTPVLPSTPVVPTAPVEPVMPTAPNVGVGAPVAPTMPMDTPVAPVAPTMPMAPTYPMDLNNVGIQ